MLRAAGSHLPWASHLAPTWRGHSYWKMKMAGEDHSGVFATQCEGILSSPTPSPCSLAPGLTPLLGHGYVTHNKLTCGRTVPKSQSLFHEVHFLPAGLFWKPVKGNSSASTRTFEKSLDGIMPVVVVVILHTGLQRLEIGVITLSGRRERAYETCSEGWQQLSVQRKASLSSPILRSPAVGSPP